MTTKEKSMTAPTWMDGLPAFVGTEHADKES
jgi:hypothetical protein